MRLSDKLAKVAYFLHIYDNGGQLDIVDLSFVFTVGKVILSPGIDYSALGALIAVILSKMHSDHLNSTKSVSDPEK